MIDQFAKRAGLGCVKQPFAERVAASLMACRAMSTRCFVARLSAIERTMVVTGIPSLRPISSGARSAR